MFLVDKSIRYYANIYVQWQQQAKQAVGGSTVKTGVQCLKNKFQDKDSIGKKGILREIPVSYRLG